MMRPGLGLVEMGAGSPTAAPAATDSIDSDRRHAPGNRPRGGRLTNGHGRGLAWGRVLLLLACLALALGRWLHLR